MKKKFIFIVTSLLILTLSGCATKQSTQNATSTNSKTQDNTSSKKENQSPQSSESNKNAALPLLSVTPSHTQTVDLHIQNMPSNLKVNEIKIDYFSDKTDTTVGYEDDLFYKNNEWEKKDGTTVGIINKDGSIALDFPNGYVANDTQITVNFKTKDGQTTVTEKSKIINAGLSKF